jgi:hypothetical protein
MKIMGIQQCPGFPFPLFDKLSPDADHLPLAVCVTLRMV